MTRMTGPDCVVMCNLINTYIHTYIHTYITYIRTYIHTYVHCGRKTRIGARSSLPTSSSLSLCRHVVTLAQMCMPSSRSSPSDGYSTGRRHTLMSPNMWRKGQKNHVFGGDFLLFYSRHSHSARACENPTAPCARPGVCTSASYRGG